LDILARATSVTANPYEGEFTAFAMQVSILWALEC